VALWIIGIQGGSQPARFDVHEGDAFTAPVSRRRSYQVVAIMFGVTALLSNHVGGGVATGWLAFSGFRLSWLWVVAIALAVLNVLLTLSGWPSLDLTPEALVYRHGLGTTVFPWSALTAEVTLQGRGSQLYLVLTVARPDLVRRSGLARTSPRVVMAWQRIDPTFLAMAISFYVENVDCRGRIGTSAEHERLRVTLDAA
jgi:hypothetical protein